MIIQPRKNGAPQLSCNNNFARAISHIIPNSLPKKQAILKEWLPISKDKNTWQEHIEIFFESCGTTDDDQNEYEDEDNENHLMNPEESPNESAPPWACHRTYTRNLRTSHRTLDTINSISNT